MLRRYERDEDDTVARQICTAVCYTSIGLFVFIVITVALYYTIGFVELPLMLESLVLMNGVTPNQDKLVPTSLVGFLSNSYCWNAGAEVSGACPPEVLGRCATVTTFLPTFNPATPAAASNGVAIIQSCYYDHPNIKYNTLDKAALTPYDKSAKGVWINTGCAKACSGSACATLKSEEAANSRDSTKDPTLQRCVHFRHSRGYAFYAFSFTRSDSRHLTRLVVCTATHHTPF
jgi:hypothetical protein